MDRPIGTCSNCGGTVTIHDGPWFGVVPPTPTCSMCGATPRLPMMPMGPPMRTVTSTAYDGSELLRKLNTRAETKEESLRKQTIKDVAEQIAADKILKDR